ncbi:MAG: ATP-binding protein [Bacteroidetes bacterium]|nr:ATP-binding protein [Bacteroidota bacterium]
MSDKKFTAIDSLQYLLNKPIIETAATKKIKTILTRTQNDSSMVGIIGEEGIGKSTGVAKSVLANPSSYYIRMGQSYGSKTLFHELIFLITGKQVYQSTNMNSTIDFLSNVLTETPDKKLVIIDDAGKLKSAGLGLFHELRDNTMDTTGFVFMGLEYFMNNLLKWKKEGKIGIAEFYRRINFWYSLPYLSQEEKILYLKSRNIELTEKLISILKEVNTIWELEARVNIYLQQKKIKGSRNNPPSNPKEV